MKFHTCTTSPEFPRFVRDVTHRIHALKKCLSGFLQEVSDCKRPAPWDPSRCWPGFSWLEIQGTIFLLLLSINNESIHIHPNFKPSPNQVDNFFHNSLIFCLKWTCWAGQRALGYSLQGFSLLQRIPLASYNPAKAISHVIQVVNKRTLYTTWDVATECSCSKSDKQAS